MTACRTPALLFADPSGRCYEHPRLLATVRSGRRGCSLPPEPGVPLPEGGRLCTCPAAGRWGWTRRPASWCSCPRSQVGRRRFVPDAVGALAPARLDADLPPRRGAQADGAGASAVGVHRGGWVGRGRPGRLGAAHRPAHALGPGALLHAGARRRGCEARARRTRRTGCCGSSRPARWSIAASPRRTSSTAGTRGRIPVSTMCNAALRGLHLRPARGRARRRRTSGWTTDPRAEEMARVARGPPAARAGPRAMVSFGQGCEGEPLTRWRVIAEAIRLHPRAQTAGARCNINTNGRLTAGAGRAVRRRARRRSASRSTPRWRTCTRRTTARSVRLGGRGGLDRAVARERGGLRRAQPADLPRRHRPRGRGGGAAVRSCRRTGWIRCRHGACASIRSSTWRWPATVARGGRPMGIAHGCSACSERKRPGCGWETSPGDSANGESRPALLDWLSRAPGGRPEGRI